MKTLKKNQAHYLFFLFLLAFLSFPTHVGLIAAVSEVGDGDAGMINHDMAKFVNNPQGQEEEHGLKHYIELIRPGFKIGAFISNPERISSKIKNFVLDNFNAVTVGVYMTQNQPEQDVWSFSESDDRMAWAKSNGLSIKLHPFFGHNSFTPDWLINGGFNEQQLVQIMYERIQTLTARYGNDIHAIEVVNEPISGTENKNWADHLPNNAWMGMGWTESNGTRVPKYVDHSFKHVLEKVPDYVELIINENSNSMWNTQDGTLSSRKTKNSFGAVQEMLSAGIPVDGLGLQVHLAVKDGVLREGEKGGQGEMNLEAFKNALAYYGQLGIDIHITEFDVHLPENPSSQDYAVQAKAYRDYLKAALESPYCKSFTTWGVDDLRGWKPQNYNPHALWLDANEDPKNNYHEVIKMLKGMSSGDPVVLSLLSSNEELSAKISLYPNPSATGKVLVSLAGYSKQQVNIEVIDLSGRMVYRKLLNVNTDFKEFQINTSNLANGIYNVRVVGTAGIENAKLMLK